MNDLEREVATLRIVVSLLRNRDTVATIRPMCPITAPTTLPWTMGPLYQLNILPPGQVPDYPQLWAEIGESIPWVPSESLCDSESGVLDNTFQIFGESTES